MGRKMYDWGGERYKGERPNPKRERPTPAVPRHRKDTKRWCLGKVGREHETEIVQRHWYGRDYPCRPTFGWFMCNEREVCKKCGKVIRHSLGDNCSVLTLKRPGS